ncbi:hypothetical protein PMAYCL1PPCAC_10719, partial [Pristionchus mayeri]
QNSKIITCSIHKKVARSHSQCSGPRCGFYTTVLFSNLSVSLPTLQRNVSKLSAIKHFDLSSFFHFQIYTHADVVVSSNACAKACIGELIILKLQNYRNNGLISKGISDGVDCRRTSGATNFAFAQM